MPPPKPRQVDKRKRSDTGDSMSNTSQQPAKTKKYTVTVEDTDNGAIPSDTESQPDEAMSDAEEQEREETPSPPPTNLRRSTRANRNEQPARAVQEGALYRAGLRSAAQAKKDEKAAKSAAKVSQKAAENRKVAAGSAAVSRLVRSKVAQDAVTYAKDRAPTSSSELEDDEDKTDQQNNSDGKIEATCDSPPGSPTDEPPCPSSHKVGVRALISLDLE
jgi:hypothetical protein